MMEHLIPMMNNIHTILKKAGLDDEIELPRFVVIGSQSVGKSSVLESIAGFGFLPRGDGLVTRCPLIMQLVNSNSQKPYAVFNHKPNEKMFDFDKVKEEILRQTNILAGEGGNIVEDEITVTIYSKSVVNLTLIDLPGFIQFSMEDQSDDLPEQIKQLVEKYICKENTLILAIHPAGVDTVPCKQFES